MTFRTGSALSYAKRHLTVCAALAVLASAAQANLIPNGSFETGDFAGGLDATMVLPAGSHAISSWTVGAGAVCFRLCGMGSEIAWIEDGNPWGLSALDGNRFLNLNAFKTVGGGISARFPTVPGREYLVSYSIGYYTER